MTDDLAARVKGKVGGGYFRQALEDGLKPDPISRLIYAFDEGKKMRGRAVDDGTVRQLLERHGWTADEIGFAIYHKTPEQFAADAEEMIRKFKEGI